MDFRWVLPVRFHTFTNLCIIETGVLTRRVESAILVFHSTHIHFCSLTGIVVLITVRAAAAKIRGNADHP